MKQARLLFLLLSACLCQAVWAQQDSDQPLVLASLAPVYQLTLPLLANTSIQLQLLPDSPRSMQSHSTLFIRQAERYAEAFRHADAVLSIAKIWNADPFYITARQFNIRVVNIDASKPWSHDLDGVAVTNNPVSNLTSVYFWLSPANIIRMINTIANDLQALYPQYAEHISANAEQEKALWRTLKAKAESRLLEAADPLVFALTEDFVYLTSDLAIFVDDYFIKQDIDWNDADLKALTSKLQNDGVKVVIHKWQPSAPIQEAISAAGATLVVLDTLETTTDFRKGMEDNLNRLFSAFPAL